MFNEQLEEDEVSSYGDEIEMKLDTFTEQMDILQTAMDKLKLEGAEDARRKFREEEEIRIQTRFEEEKRLEDMRIQMRADVDASRTNENVITVKP